LDHDQKVLLAAADTFRAAAREQLAVWADRADGRAQLPRGQVDIISQQGGDPAAVSFDAVNAGRARGCDVVIADTAGRLPTQLHLMEELKKIRRVIAKAQPDAPHEVMLVLDGSTGQNALEQARHFTAATNVTALTITKLDGTAKGGVVLAIASQFKIPVKFIGVGEKAEDLLVFDKAEFVDGLFNLSAEQ
ncbi:MAG TPA: signal recognition particle-docking protein FtsY, partial [Ferruginibacter sp.]|nr:signal recognition particle-docking protein FtsY [Ferruginibacter sp.]